MAVRTLNRATTTFPLVDSSPPGRPSWSGLLQINLVGIPLKAYPAVRTRQAPAFHQLHAACGQRIRCPKHCPAHGPLTTADIVRAYEYGPGQHLVLEAEELDQLRPPQDRALRLERFASPDHCDPLLFSGRSLYLLPDGPAAVHGYGVLQEVMAARSRWGVGQMVLSGQRQVVLVRPIGQVLVLHVLHYPELVRAWPAAPPSSRAALDAELDLAGQLLDAASGPVSWSSYRDETAAEMRALVEAKLQGRSASTEPEPVLLPLLEALQQSLAATNGTPEVAAAAPAPRQRKRRRA